MVHHRRVALGVASDVHGNLVALDAVLADGAARGVTRWWFLGDLVAIGPEPVATAERLRSLPSVEIITGNTDRYARTRDRPYPSMADVEADLTLLPRLTAVEGSFAWTRGALAAHGLLDWLAALPAEVRTTLADGTRVLGVHATPVADDGPGISPHRPEHELAADLAGCDADIVIGGHTHRVTDRTIGGVRVLNGGSVGNPTTDDKRASYLVLDDDGSVEHRWVDYDHAEFLRRLHASGHPETAFIASFVS
jgi:predicted phosphodiesterase